MINLSKNASRRFFARAASRYDDAAVLQREVANRVLERIDAIKELAPQVILDLGCGTGYALKPLGEKYPEAAVIGIDLAFPMLTVARQPLLATDQTHLLCTDAELLPLADNSVDLVISNLTLQWCNPVQVFDECYRVLRPGGLFLFTTFGPGTLAELREAWTQVDDHPHVHDFVDIHDIGDLLLKARFTDPVMDMDTLTLTYSDVPAMLRDLKDIGASNAAVNRKRGLTGRKHFQSFCRAYEAMAIDNRIPASYEVIYGHAWRSASVDAIAGSDNGSVYKVPLSKIGRTSE